MTRTTGLRILVAIANHGVKNRHFLDRLIAEYRSLDADVDIVVLSDAPKDLGADIEVRVGAPTENPWSLPFAHKSLFAERADDYDLFIYSEDDTEITEDHLVAFLESCDHLPDGFIAGFLRHETAPDGRKFCSTIHGPYHWDPGVLFSAGGHVYARYTNDHAAAFILTRDQLKRGIDEGGFLCEAHEGRYDMLCSAATDPYTRCGMTKVIRISELARFSLHHLPDIYLGKIGMTWEDLELQVNRLLRLEAAGGPRARMFATRTGLDAIRYDKNHDEPLNDALAAKITAAGGDVLSIGCEGGATEIALVSKGVAVAAAPLDVAVAAKAEALGVEVLSPDLDETAAALGDRRFDWVLLNDVLAYVDDPHEILKRAARSLKPGGAIAVVARNAASASMRRDFARRFGPSSAIFPPTELMGRAGYRLCDEAAIKRWLKAEGYAPRETLNHVSDRRRGMSRLSLGLADRYLAERITVIADAPAHAP